MTRESERWEAHEETDRSGQRRWNITLSDHIAHVAYTIDKRYADLICKLHNERAGSLTERVLAKTELEKLHTVIESNGHYCDGMSDAWLDAQIEAQRADIAEAEAARMRAAIEGYEHVINRVRDLTDDHESADIDFTVGTLLRERQVFLQRAETAEQALTAERERADDYEARNKAEYFRNEELSAELSRVARELQAEREKAARVVNTLRVLCDEIQTSKNPDWPYITTFLVGTAREHLKDYDALVTPTTEASNPYPHLEALSKAARGEITEERKRVIDFNEAHDYDIRD